MNTSAPNLEYFISRKSPFLVVSLLGGVTKGNAAALETCLKEALSAAESCVVLSFHDISHFDLSGIPLIVRFQKALREKPAEIRIAFLKPDFRRMLVDAGAVRPQELADNLLNALQSFNSK